MNKILYEPLVWFLKRFVVLFAVSQFCCWQQSSAADIRIPRDSVRLNKIIGKVTDVYNKPLTDVSVSIKGKQSGTYTDLDGYFELEIEKGKALVFSVIAFKTKEEFPSGNGPMTVILEGSPPAQQRFHTLYTATKKNLSTAALTEIYTNDLLKNQTPSVAGLLQGRVAGLSGFQSTGQPGGDGVQLSLRGQTPIVWLDGVPQSFASINPEQIESITLIKDAASLAMLGIRGSNGLIMVTTKKGTQGPQKISFTALTGLQNSLSRPKFLHAYDYSRLYNEALLNDGKSAVYSAADLEAFKNGSDPIGHPDVDWQKELLKDNSPYSRYDLTVTGGRKVARYFVNLDYLDQQGELKTADFNKYNTGSGYKRYGFRTNVDLDLSNSVTAFVNIFTRIQTVTQPGGGKTAGIFQNLRSTPNNSYPLLNSNGSLGGNLDYQNNLYGQSVYSGYSPLYTRDFRVDLGMKGNLDRITPGLWVRGRASINAFLQETINRTKTFAVFHETKDAAGLPVYKQYGTNTVMTNTIGVDVQNRRFYTELATGYTRNFNEHGLEVLLLGNVDNVMSNSDLPIDVQGISGKVSYNFSEKYMLDLTFAYNGSQAYPRNHRYGFFPAIGMGWNISKENFLKDQKWLNTLKLRANYGKTGNNNALYYEYNKYYNIFSGTGGYNLGQSATPLNGVSEGALNNPDLRWEKAMKLNAGIDAELFNNSLLLTADYYIDQYSDLLQQRGTGSYIIGNTYPRLNIGKQRYSGLELQLTYQKKAGEFSYFISPNAAWTQSKVKFQDEVSRKYSWMERTGRPVGQAFGLTAEGLFQSADEISKSAVPVGMSPKPGDIKYKDLNGDGLIDENDISEIGGTKPTFLFGVNLGGSWKGFDFSALFQGVTNRRVYLSGNSYWAFLNSGKDQAYAHHLNRWTPENAANATYPRLAVGQNINNELNSSYWLRPANYLRLKSIELGYSLPVSAVKRLKLSGARFFVNGYNLFTTTQLDGMDPEGFNGGYPVQKLITAGVNIKL